MCLNFDINDNPRTESHRKFFLVTSCFHFRNDELFIYLFILLSSFNTENAEHGEKSFLVPMCLNFDINDNPRTESRRKFFLVTNCFHFRNDELFN